MAQVQVKIEEILANRLITPLHLVDKYGFKSFNSGNVTRVNSTPSQVEMCNTDFSASFIFFE